MTTKEILEIEGDLNKRLQERNIIYLIRDKENSPWYRAYNWSAYLMEFYPNNIEEGKRLKPTHKLIKNGEGSSDIVYVGLQLSSFRKYIPDIEIEDDPNSSILKIRIDITNYDVALDSESYGSWINNIPLKEPPKENRDKQQNKNQIIYSQPTTFTSIMRDILRCNILNITGEEAIEFINYLKLECTKLI